MDKWKSKKGETLVESLCAILIVTLSILLLSNSIASAVRVNDGAAKLRKNLQFAAGAAMTNCTVELDGTLLNDLTVYQTEQGYFYYEK